MRKLCATKLLVSCVLLLALSACSGAGSGGDSSGGSTGSETTVKGSIASETGGQRAMQNWLVALIEKETGITRIGEVDAAGSFVLKNVNTARSHAVVLLSADMKLSSVLTMPGAKANTVRQYFKVSGATLPRIIHKGPMSSFFSTSQIVVQSDVAKDSDGDGVPDGMESSISTSLNLTGSGSSSSGSGLRLKSDEDTDGDDIANINDPDIDGDGIPNHFDVDADGDSIQNIFDLDANGDGVADSSQQKGVQYFSEGVEYISSQVLVEAQESGEERVSIVVTAKLREGVSPVAVRLRGPVALFNGSTVEITDSAGNTTPQAFDGRLLDDGSNEDGAANDRIYGRKIILESGKLPKSNQVIFAQLGFGSTKEPWYKEYPYTFPNVTMGSVSATYDANTTTVSIIGDPFGEITGYSWSASFLNSDGTVVYTTPLVSGGTDIFQIPSDTLDDGESYDVIIYAQSLAPVPGAPAYMVSSLKTPI